jgi:hypothetical protein
MAAAAALGSSSSDWFSNVSSWVRQRTSTVANTSALVGHPGATLSGLPPLPRQSQNHQQQPQQQQQQQQQQPREWQTNGGSDAVAGSTQPRTSASRRTTNASAGSSGGTGPGAGYGGGMMAGGGGLSTASSTWGAIKNYSRWVEHGLSRIRVGDAACHKSKHQSSKAAVVSCSMCFHHAQFELI